jgi:hypothetical protein
MAKFRHKKAGTRVMVPALFVMTILFIVVSIAFRQRGPEDVTEACTTVG